MACPVACFGGADLLLKWQWVGSGQLAPGCVAECRRQGTPRKKTGQGEGTGTHGHQRWLLGAFQ